MRYARGIALLGFTAIAAFAFAGQALAQGVEVEDALTGEHCGEVIVGSHEVSGGCEIVKHSTNVILTSHLSPTFEVAGSVCDAELEGYIDEQGEGYATHQVLSGSSCTTPPCYEGPDIKDLWPLHVSEAGPPEAEQEQLLIHWCIVSATFGEILCELPADIVGGAGNYTVEAEDRPCANMTSFPRFEITGHGLAESQGVIIRHADDASDS